MIQKSLDPYSVIEEELDYHCLCLPWQLDLNLCHFCSDERVSHHMTQEYMIEANLF